MKTKDHPGVYIPPPLIYVAVFFFSVLLQKLFPLKGIGLNSEKTLIIGWILILLSLLLTFPALWRFLVSKNSLIPIKSANSLQTEGIYSFTRNPMYLGLIVLYTGVAFLKGNDWTFILIPLLIIIVQLYVIRKEENYLQRVFGEKFNDYVKKVRRWI
ncbi:MAG: isoprenylcysteine carboxylmethyltransferase family protein [Chitinophagaceae bacterium]|nr:isoprenylcysteine carboxylmethyltransferase family protein [Chitinophagaceae bacterium]